jgi:hypothetical protein
MPELRNLQRPRPTTAVIEMGEGDQVRVTFDRNKITSEWDRENRRQAEDPTGGTLAKALADVILMWDVTEDDVPLSPTVANIERLSIPAQGDLFYRIMKASAPSDAEGEVSGALSSQSQLEPQPGSTPQSPERVPTPQNGQEPSQSPAPSASPSPT